MNRDRNLDELIGADTTGAERERLQRAHDMLLEAGPPPELSPKLEEGPTLGMTLSKRRAVKRRGMLLPLRPAGLRMLPSEVRDGASIRFSSCLSCDGYPHTAIMPLNAAE